MEFSLGFLDAIFGKRVILEFSNPEGVRKVSVTEKWFKEMKHKGHISPISTVRVHVLNLTRIDVMKWVIGKDVSQEDLEKFRDTSSNDLYAITHFEDGKPVINLMKKVLWEYAALQLGIATGISEEEALKIKTDIESLILSRGGKPI